MAKKEENTENTENQAAAVEESKTDERYRWVTHPKTNEQVKRKDYILELWGSREWTRGEIAKHLTEITGKNVPYQIVFQATKGVEGGKPKEEKAAESSDNSGEAA